ncbi:hypothetical protein BV394_01105 [Brevirhabdus pacifica]|uniref:DUF177 domain-containing protein n=1 Tax=Brevirhabdus pacifica TaxID=1267768 RepID=A0A1U7DLN3_9RHOB|nr:hypothetical protein BV394_01105 [Brevirhabdus pacifica]OWU80321.1 50S ribosomal protein L34 [Loktanella sp. 22II-4b]
MRVADLATRKPNRFNLQPAAADLPPLAEELGISAVEGLSFSGTLQAKGKSEWVLKGRLKARVVQPCVVTTEPVTTAIDEEVTRRFLPDLPDEGAEGEVEMPEDETLEVLGRFIDPGQVMREALALALPLYPRRKGAALGEAVFAQPGVEPLTDEALRPFAGLSDLRDRLKK